MSNKLIDRLEEITEQFTELTNEAKVIFQQLRRPSTIQTVEDVIEFEGQQYKKVDRKARCGDVVVFKESHASCVTAGKAYKAYGQSRLIFRDDEGDGVLVYGGGVAKGTPEIVDVYELIEEDTSVDWLDELFDEDKSPNQQRAEIIAKAKKSIVKKLVVRNGQSVYIKRTGKQEWVNVEFVVNEEKRTVVAIARWTKNNEIVARGIAKCMPTDVFNTHIGKAIALGRALGIDVSEFENAVQPDEAVKGMYCQHKLTDYKGELTRFNKTAKHWDGTEDISGSHPRNLKIINDTNAEYEVNA